MEALRDALQPLQVVTHALPTPVSNFGKTLIGDKCYKSLVFDIDVTDTECLKLSISKGLGLGIVGASSVVKVPQILKLVDSKSASGISFLSYLLETSSYLISLAYNHRNNFPFSTYGETALILAQNAVITVLVLNYSGKASMAAMFVAALAASVATLFSKEIINMEQMSILQAGAGTLGVASKLPQILAIWQQGGTGQLSSFTVFNYLIGSLVRIFTTFQEVDDKLILYGFVAGFVLNLVLAAQMVYYWNVETPSAKVQGEQKEKMAIGSSPAATSASSSATKSKAPTTRRRG